MKFTYEDLDLSAEVTEDLMEFGPDLEVIAIYSTFPEFPNVDFVTDYLESLQTLKKRKYKRMSLYELGKIIQRQAEIF